MSFQVSSNSAKAFGADKWKSGAFESLNEFRVLVAAFNATDELGEKQLDEWRDVSQNDEWMRRLTEWKCDVISKLSRSNEVQMIFFRIEVVERLLMLILIISLILSRGWWLRQPKAHWRCDANEIERKMKKNSERKRLKSRRLNVRKWCRWCERKMNLRPIQQIAKCCGSYNYSH